MKTVSSVIATISVAASLLISEPAFSGIASSITKVFGIRPYIGNNAVYVQTLDNAACGTSVFMIDLAKPNGKSAYAAALTAYTMHSDVIVEISNNTGCKGWGTEMQSIEIR